METQVNKRFGMECVTPVESVIYSKDPFSKVTRVRLSHLSERKETVLVKPIKYNICLVLSQFKFAVPTKMSMFPPEILNSEFER